MRVIRTTAADHGRKKQEVLLPARERVAMRAALKQQRILRYWENVRVWNPDYTNRAGEQTGGWQWIDFVFVHRSRLFAILYGAAWRGSGPNAAQKRWHEQKKRLLEKRNLPHVVVKRSGTGQDYQMAIYKMLHLTK